MNIEKTIKMLQEKRKTLLVLRADTDLEDRNEINRLDVSIATVTSQLYQLTKNPVYRVNQSARIKKRNGEI